MKKVIFFLLAISMAGIFTANAQGGGMQRRTPEEQLKQVKEKLADLKLTSDQATKSDSVFVNFFRTRDKMFADMMAGGGQPDREAMREKSQKLMTDRDDNLKKVFTEEQFKKWKDVIEPSMRQRRPGGGGGPQGGSGTN